MRNLVKNFQKLKSTPYFGAASGDQGVILILDRVITPNEIRWISGLQ